MKLFSRLVLVLLLSVAACTTARASSKCSRPKVGRGWSVSKINLDRVRRCRGKRWWNCRSALTKQDYRVFTRSHLKRQQKKLFISQVNVPKRSKTQNVVIAIAGQQTQNGFIFAPNNGQKNGVTGQQASYRDKFRRRTSSIKYAINPNALVNNILRTGLFSKSDTFVGVVFDARFHWEYFASRKNKIVTAYCNYIVDKLGKDVKTIYLAGSSRGGCLVMRVSARLAQKFPRTRIIVHTFDGVCAPKAAYLPWTKGEFGVTTHSIRNPVKAGNKVYTTNIWKQFPSKNCIAVRSFLTGQKVYISRARAFGHLTFTGKQNSLTNPAGFDWYTQSFHTEGHNAITFKHHHLAVNHLRKSLKGLPCECSGSSASNKRQVRSSYSRDIRFPESASLPLK